MLSSDYIKFIDANPLGELLRGITFIGEYGCHHSFDVRGDAVSWPAEQRMKWWRDIFHYEDEDEEGYSQCREAADLGEGYSYKLSTYTIDVCWYWDGDGVLTFGVSDDEGKMLRLLINDDCKKSYRWENQIGG